MNQQQPRTRSARRRPTSLLILVVLLIGSLASPATAQDDWEWNGDDSTSDSHAPAYAVDDGLVAVDTVSPIYVDSDAYAVASGSDGTADTVEGVGGWDDATDVVYSDNSYAGSLTNVRALIGADAYWSSGSTGHGVDIAMIDTGVVPVRVSTM